MTDEERDEKMIGLNWPLLKLPANEFEYKEVPVEVEGEDKMKVAFIILQGIHTGYVVGESLLLAHSDQETMEEAKVYEIKHMVLSDLAKYKRLVKYYADPACQTYRQIAESLPGLYPHIIEGEIVTLVFFHPVLEEHTEVEVSD